MAYIRTQKEPGVSPVGAGTEYLRPEGVSSHLDMRSQGTPSDEGRCERSARGAACEINVSGAKKRAPIAGGMTGARRGSTSLPASVVECPSIRDNVSRTRMRRARPDVAVLARCRVSTAVPKEHR